MSIVDDKEFNQQMARQHKESGKRFLTAYDAFREAVKQDGGFQLEREIREAHDAGSWLMGWWAATRRRLS